MDGKKELKKNIIVVSACLLGKPTRFDGELKEDPFVKFLVSDFEVIPVCPEVGIGFPVPRPRVFLYKTENSIKIIQEGSKRDITPDVENFCRKFLKNLPKERILGFILKSKSPSCSPTLTTKTYADLEGKILLEERNMGILGKLAIRLFPDAFVIDELLLRKTLDFFIKALSLKLET